MKESIYFKKKQKSKVLFLSPSAVSFKFFLTAIFRLSPQITEVFFYFSRNFLFNG